MARSRAPAPLSALAAQAGAKAFARYGFTEQTLLNHWSAIMGEMLGRMTLPLRLSFPRGSHSGGTLRVLAEGPAALELQHLAPVVIERINSAFGFPAVKSLSIVQGPAARGDGRKPEARPLSPEAEARLASLLEAVEDEALRQSLTRLGRSLYGAQ